MVGVFALQENVLWLPFRLPRLSTSQAHLPLDQSANELRTAVRAALKSSLITNRTSSKVPLRLVFYSDPSGSLTGDSKDLQVPVTYASEFGQETETVVADGVPASFLRELDRLTTPAAPTQLAELSSWWLAALSDYTSLCSSLIQRDITTVSFGLFWAYNCQKATSVLDREPGPLIKHRRFGVTNSNAPHRTKPPPGRRDEEDEDPAQPLVPQSLLGLQHPGSLPKKDQRIWVFVYTNVDMPREKSGSNKANPPEMTGLIPVPCVYRGGTWGSQVIPAPEPLAPLPMPDPLPDEGPTNRELREINGGSMSTFADYQRNSFEAGQRAGRNWCHRNYWSKVMQGKRAQVQALEQEGISPSIFSGSKTIAEWQEVGVIKSEPGIRDESGGDHGLLIFWLPCLDHPTLSKLIQNDTVMVRTAPHTGKAADRNFEVQKISGIDSLNAFPLKLKGRGAWIVSLHMAFHSGCAMPPRLGGLRVETPDASLQILWTPQPLTDAQRELCDNTQIGPCRRQVLTSCAAAVSGGRTAAAARLVRGSRPVKKRRMARMVPASQPLATSFATPLVRSRDAGRGRGGGSGPDQQPDWIALARQRQQQYKRRSVQEASIRALVKPSALKARLKPSKAELTLKQQGLDTDNYRPVSSQGTLDADWDLVLRETPVEIQALIEDAPAALDDFGHWTPSPGRPIWVYLRSEEASAAPMSDGRGERGWEWTLCQVSRARGDSSGLVTTARIRIMRTDGTARSQPLSAHSRRLPTTGWLWWRYCTFVQGQQGLEVPVDVWDPDQILRMDIIDPDGRVRPQALEPHMPEHTSQTVFQDPGQLYGQGHWLPEHSAERLAPESTCSVSLY